MQIWKTILSKLLHLVLAETDFPVNCIFVTFHLTLTWLFRTSGFLTLRSLTSKLLRLTAFFQSWKVGKIYWKHTTPKKTWNVKTLQIIFQKVSNLPFLQESGLTQIWRSCMRLPQGEISIKIFKLCIMIYKLLCMC